MVVVAAHAPPNPVWVLGFKLRLLGSFLLNAQGWAPLECELPSQALPYLKTHCRLKLLLPESLPVHWPELGGSQLLRAAWRCKTPIKGVGREEKPG